jgi:hypothetical protein
MHADHTAVFMSMRSFPEMASCATTELLDSMIMLMLSSHDLDHPPFFRNKSTFNDREHDDRPLRGWKIVNDRKAGFQVC